MLTKTEPVHIPDEALHLATDCQIARTLRKHGHTVKSHGKTAIATHKDTGVYCAWTTRGDGEGHPMAYRAQIIRALVRLKFFVVVAVAAALGILALAI